MFNDRIKQMSSELDTFIEYDHAVLDRIIQEGEKAAKAWSGSFLGYHSCVYYEQLETPPAGAHFSSEWGLDDSMNFLRMGTTGNWVEYKYDDIINYINSSAGSPDLGPIRKISIEANEKIDQIKSSVLSIIHSQENLKNDNYIMRLMDELEHIKCFNADEISKASLPKGQLMTRDRRVEHKIKIPPHISIISMAYSLASPFVAARQLKKSLSKLNDYLNNLEIKMAKENRVGTNIFIGHGRSSDWRDLKDFIHERLNLPYDEFNRVPVAGLTNITRLAQMLDQAAIAFLVMSAEDEQSDGNMHARMNVIHEVGLFQGRLGFERAIVLLEEGCQEFSNIEGLGQIRYPKNNINAIFEDIRLVLEREGLL